MTMAAAAADGTDAAAVGEPVTSSQWKALAKQLRTTNSSCEITDHGWWQ